MLFFAENEVTVASYDVFCGNIKLKGVKEHYDISHLRHLYSAVECTSLWRRLTSTHSAVDKLAHCTGL
jgi:hypothetical protein